MPIHSSVIRRARRIPWRGIPIVGHLYENHCVCESHANQDSRLVVLCTGNVKPHTGESKWIQA